MCSDLWRALRAAPLGHFMHIVGLWSRKQGFRRNVISKRSHGAADAESDRHRLRIKGRHPESATATTVTLSHMGKNVSHANFSATKQRLQLRFNEDVSIHVEVVYSRLHREFTDIVENCKPTIALMKIHT